MFLKPAPGRDVPDLERGGLLAADGREVTMTTYWSRRVDDGDVVELEPAETVLAPIVQTSAQSGTKAK